MSFYVTTPIYYVNSAPAPGARVHDDRRRHRGRGTCGSGARTSSSSRAPTSTPRPPGPSGPPRRGASRRRSSSTAWLGRFNRRLASDLQATNDFFIRTTDAGHKAWFVQGFLEKLHKRQRPRLRGHLRRPLLRRGARRSTARTSSSTAEGARSTARSPASWRSATGSSGCPRSPSRCWPTTRRSRTSWVPRSRYNERHLHRGRARRRVALPRVRCSGASRCPGTPEQTIYVWFDALLNYTSALTYARPGEDLTDRYWPAPLAAPGQGHPQVPRRHLAGDAARRPGYALPRQLLIHGYLTVRRRGKDVEDEGQRPRPLPRDRPLRRSTRCATTCSETSASAADGAVSYETPCTSATTRRPRQRPRQPRQPLAGDDRPLPRGHGARGGHRPGHRRRAVGVEAPRASRRARRALRAHTRRSRRPGSRCGGRSTASSRERAPWTLAKDQPRARGSSTSGARLAGRRRPRRRASCSPGVMPGTAEDAAGGRARGPVVGRGAGRRGRGRRGARRVGELFPRIEAEAPAA